jgi:hypothetical protein
VTQMIYIFSYDIFCIQDVSFAHLFSPQNGWKKVLKQWVIWCTTSKINEREKSSDANGGVMIVTLPI